jgi:adenylosuccinate synthase
MSDTTAARNWNDLPEKARAYLERLCQIIGAPLDIVSVGPHREQTIMVRDPYKVVPQQVGKLVQTLGREG